MTDFPRAQLVNVGEVDLAVYQTGPRPDETGKPPVVLVHGWPELAWSWRHVMPRLAAAGYPVIAPDMRGYGASDKPEGVENYGMRQLTGDLAGLLDALDIQKAIFVGHDWGAITTWSLPFYAPDRILALAGLNVPFQPRNPAYDPITLFRKYLGEDHYIVTMQDEGVVEAILEKDLARTFLYIMRAPATTGQGGKVAKSMAIFDMLDLPEDQWPGIAFVPDNELAVYVDAFERGGMTTPIHWYRNMVANWQEMETMQPPGEAVSFDWPTLMITADRDMAVPATLSDGMERYFTNYTRVDLTDCGHWSAQQQPEEVSSALLAWLDGFQG